MRPKSILTFERLVLLSIGIGILNVFLVREQTAAALQAQGSPIGSGTLYTVQAIMILLYLLLVWFISRKRSSVAKWIYVVLAGLGLAMGLAGLQSTLSLGTLPFLITLVQYAITLATIWLLFRPDATAWFRDGRGERDSSELR
jgi:hypothetical protein